MQKLLLTFVLALAVSYAQAQNIYDNAKEAEKAIKVHVDTSKEPLIKGKYQPTWESLSDYQCPEWFRDAKFGIWAHWGRSVSRSMATGSVAACIMKAATSIPIVR